MRLIMVLVVALSSALSSLLLAACGSDGDESSATSSTSSTATTSSTTTTTTTTDTTATTAPAAGGTTSAPTRDGPPASPGGLAGGTRSPISVPAAGPALLTNVRGSPQAGFDRVAFEFEAALPGYSVRYVDRPIRSDPSDQEVPLKGDGVIEVRMEQASGVDLAGEEFRQTYKGPSRLEVGGPVVVELARTSDFESVLVWVIGVKDRPAFKISTLMSPSRLVVDVG